MAYSKQTWDTNSVFNPTRMNNIENGIYNNSVENCIRNISSVTENIISCGSGETVSYTTTAKGWYRAVIINTGGPDVSLRVNGKSFAYLNVQGRYEMVVPLDAGVALTATVVGNGAIYLNKFNF